MLAADYLRACVKEVRGSTNVYSKNLYSSWWGLPRLSSSQPPALLCSSLEGQKLICITLLGEHYHNKEDREQARIEKIMSSRCLLEREPPTLVMSLSREVSQLCVESAQ